MDLGLAQGIYSNKLEGNANGIYDNINTGLHNGIYNENLLPNNVIKNGLLLYLDAAYTKSYPRSGIKWNNLINNKYNGILTNNPNYNSNNNGVINFSGSLRYVLCNIGKLELNAGSAYSISLWFTCIGSATGGIFQIANVASSQDPFLLLQRNTTTTIRWYMNDNYQLTNTNINSEIFYNITITYDGVIHRTYVNAVAQGTYSNVVGNKPGLYTWIGNGYLDTFTGQIANFLMYNRVLSQSEINQNYIATKSRFNL